MTRAIRSLLVAVVALLPAAAVAGPAEDANAVVDGWAAAYSANDIDRVVALYAPDAILLGTTSPIISRGTGEIRSYFQDLPGSGRRNAIGERYTVVLADDAVLATGFYEFSRKAENYTPRPSRFTMLVARRDGRWLIVHHHSSPRAAERR